MGARPEVLAVLPARGGSRGIPRKHCRVLGDRPMIAHTIAQARECPLVTRVIVTTDDPEIAAISREHGAEVPYLRPPHLATDTARLDDVFGHLQEFLIREEGYRYDYWVTLFPTSPFRNPGLLEQALRMMLAAPRAGWLHCLAPLSPPPCHVFSWDGTVRRAFADAPHFRSASPFFRTNMSIMLERAPVCPENSGHLGLPLTPLEAVDLDEPEDWELAEAVVGHRLFPEPEEEIARYRGREGRKP